MFLIIKIAIGVVLQFKEDECKTFSSDKLVYVHNAKILNSACHKNDEITEGILNKFKICTFMLKIL